MDAAYPRRREDHAQAIFERLFERQPVDGRIPTPLTTLIREPHRDQRIYRDVEEVRGEPVVLGRRDVTVVG